MRSCWGRVFVVVIGFFLSELADAQMANSQVSVNKLPITVGAPRGIGAVNAKALRSAAPALRSAAPLVGAESEGGSQISTNSYNGTFTGNTLPFWTFNVKGSRDNDHHLGVMVGHDPFRNPGTDRIPTYLVPLIIRTHSVATAYDPSTGYYTVAPGVTTINPEKADNTCLAAPNNVPIKLIQQSPIVNPAPFVFGGVSMGNTQYVDAFQRANFWKVLQNASSDYHVLLDPVTTIEPIVIDVPATAGLALTDPNLFVAAYGFTYCAPLVLVDINWFDSYLTGTVIPSLQEQGIGPSTFPVFLTYNAAWPVGDVTFINNCCAIGYHGSTGVPIITQTYGVVDFDTTGWFLGPATGLGTSVMSHEVAEWMNDPFGYNETAPWGNTGQVVGCQANLEVGDPLTGSTLPNVIMPNGYSYSLQELAFFSWFFGSPSIGVNGWFSDNGTFTTDAGPNCPHP
jgi:hypothetical protein